MSQVAQPALRSGPHGAGSLAQHLARGLGAQAHHHTEHQGLGLVLRKLPQEGQGLTSAEHVLDPQVVVDWIRRIHQQ